MGTTITKEVVAGSDIDPSLSGMYIEKDAVPAVQEFLRNAVGEETCFIMCWDHRPAEQAKALAVSLLRQVNIFCTSASLDIPYVTDKYSDTSLIISQSSIEGTLHNIREFSDGETYSASEVEKAADVLNLGAYHYNPHMGYNYGPSYPPKAVPKTYDHPKLAPRSSYSDLAHCYRTDYILTCENEKEWEFTGRLTCEKPTTF